MYDYIRGKLIQKNAVYVVLDVQGIGYKIFVPLSLLEQLPPQGEVVLHTSFVVRELSQALYGFLQPEERDLFETLIQLSGIGPKLALSLLGHLNLQQLQAAVSEQNAQQLQQV